MTKFKVGDKVRILDVKSIDYGSKFWQNGDITKVTRIKAERGVYLATPCSSDEGLYVTKTELDYIEKVSDTPTKNQRLTDAERTITTLESEVAELKAKVEALEKAQKPSNKLSGEYAILHEGEEIIRGNFKTPNEQRKAIIAEAKAFVEDALLAVVDGHGDYRLPNGNYVQFETIVNAEKRTVVVLAKSWYSGEVRFKYFAKCAPDDVFNADIGKAIALGRALGLDVSRFEQAVKPTEVVVGTKVDDEGDIQTVSELIETPYKTLFTGEKVSGQAFNTEESVGWLTESQVTIVDDTGAKY